MKNLISLLIVFLLCNSFAFAKHLSPAEAEGIAHDFFAQKSTNKSAKAIALAAQSESYYVYNRGENAGFVIVAADDVARSEVLGYADSGTFTAENAPEPLKALLLGYDSEYEAYKLQPTAATRNKSAVSRPSIKPLITSKWSQDWPYNSACPTIDGINCRVGCAAVALAQVLRYHRMPDQPVGEHSYEWTPEGGEQQVLSIDFETISFDWDKMPNVSENTTPTEQIDEVAEFLYAVGVALSTNYFLEYSESYLYKVLQALFEHFDCDKGSRLVYSSFFTVEEWENILYQELAENRPMIYSGGDFGTGFNHGFILDGYNDGLFHVNWGWNGSCDGYYALSAFRALTLNMSFSHAALLGVQKAKTGSKYMPTCVLVGDISTEQAEVSFSEKVSFSANAFSMINADVQRFVLPALKIVPVYGGEPIYMANLEKEGIEDEKHLVLSDSMRLCYESFSLEMNEFPRETGKYRVYPALYDFHCECYFDFLPRYNNKVSYWEAEVVGEKIIFSKPEPQKTNNPEFTITQLSKAYAGKSLEVQIEGRSKGDSFRNLLYLAFLNEEKTEQVSTFNGSYWCEMSADGTFSVTLRGPAPVEPGNYYLAVSIDIGAESMEIVSDYLPITVYPASEGEIFLEFEDLLRIDNASAVDPAHFRATARVTNLDGVFADDLWLYIFDAADGREVLYFLMKFATISEGETVEVEFEADYSGYDIGRNLIARIAYTDGYGAYYIDTKDGILDFPFRFAQMSSNTRKINASERFSVFDRSGRLIRTNATIDDVRNLPRDIYIFKSESGKTLKIRK